MKFKKKKEKKKLKIFDATNERIEEKWDIDYENTIMYRNRN